MNFQEPAFPPFPSATAVYVGNIGIPVAPFLDLGELRQMGFAGPISANNIYSADVVLSKHLEHSVETNSLNIYDNGVMKAQTLHDAAVDIYVAHNWWGDTAIVTQTLADKWDYIFAGNDGSYSETSGQELWVNSTAIHIDQDWLFGKG